MTMATIPQQCQIRRDQVPYDGSLSRLACDTVVVFLLNGIAAVEERGRPFQYHLFIYKYQVFRRDVR